VLIWTAPKPRKKEAKAPTVTERAAWWADLGGGAKDAYRAIGEMIDSPQPSVGMLKEKVRPIRAADPVAAAKLIAQLDSEEFTEREKAERALEKMGEAVAHHLIKAIQGKGDLELRRRAQRLLKKCNETSILGKQHHRAVATLEWIGTPAARALLLRLADGAPGARLTIEARGALKRLQH
jgi:hypothetical protein